MKSSRIERLAEELRREIAEAIQNRVRDPRLGMIGVTRVELSRDLSHARVYVSALGEDERQEASLRVLVGAASFIRGELARSLRLRRVPELQFRADPGIRYSIRLQEILNDLGLTDREAGPAAEEE